MSDSTGNRRFWPIRIDTFDIEWLRDHRDQLWAEAYLREQQGESIRLSPGLYEHAAIQQGRRRTADPWEEKLVEHYSGDYYRVPAADIWDILGVPMERRNLAAAGRVRSIMQLLGFRPMTVRNDKKKSVWGWAKGEKLFDGSQEGG